MTETAQCGAFKFFKFVTSPSLHFIFIFLYLFYGGAPFRSVSLCPSKLRASSRWGVALNVTALPLSAGRPFPTGRPNHWQY